MEEEERGKGERRKRNGEKEIMIFVDLHVQCTDYHLPPSFSLSPFLSLFLLLFVLPSLSLSLSSPPNKVSLTFSSQKERQEWEHTLRSLQLSLPLQQETSTVQRSSELIQMTPVPQFMWHVTLPSCRVGSEVSNTYTVHVTCMCMYLYNSCILVVHYSCQYYSLVHYVSSYFLSLSLSLLQLSSIAAPTGMANQLFVCINDVCGRGNVAILNSRSSSKDTPPQLVATLPLSSSRLICSLCVEHKNITLTNGKKERERREERENKEEGRGRGRR